MDFLGYDRAVSRGNMYSQNVMDMKGMRQSQLRDEIGNISGNLADAETNIDKTRAEERIGTGVETGVDILKTVHDAYSLRNVLNEHVKKGQEFAQKVSKQTGSQVAEQATPEPTQATPEPTQQPQSTPQSTPPEENQPTGTHLVFRVLLKDLRVLVKMLENLLLLLLAVKQVMMLKRVVLVLLDMLE